MDRRTAELRRLQDERRELERQRDNEPDGHARGRLNVKILNVNRQIIRWTKK